MPLARGARFVKRPARKARRIMTRISLRFAYAHDGIEGVNERLLRTSRPELILLILREYGARIGPHCILHGPILIHNAERDYSNLEIGKHVHIGRGCLLDLTAPIVIEDDACISMGCTILTHRDLGSRPLSALYERQVTETRIRSGAYLGANVTVMHGCTIGALAVVAAGAVVVAPVEQQTVVAGVPAVLKHAIKVEHDEPESQRHTVADR
jgi:acetyltransferase-like isoleucine patch superfamily enzyme